MLFVDKVCYFHKSAIHCYYFILALVWQTTQNITFVFVCYIINLTQLHHHWSTTTNNNINKYIQLCAQLPTFSYICIYQKPQRDLFSNIHNKSVKCVICITDKQNLHHTVHVYAWTKQNLYCYSGVIICNNTVIWQYCQFK